MPTVDEQDWFVISIICNIFLLVIFISGSVFLCFSVYKERCFSESLESSKHARSILLSLIGGELQGRSKQSVVDLMETGRSAYPRSIHYIFGRNESGEISCINYTGANLVFRDGSFVFFNDKCSVTEDFYGRALKNDQ